MAPNPFRKSFTQQEPIGEAAIAAAVDVMKSGRLHRYNSDPGEWSDTALLEAEFATWQGRRFCLACASGGYALHLALAAAGLSRGEPVLTNAFTLSPVPGAVVHAGGKPVLVETTADLVIDFDDLQRKAAATGARWLLLSHMRGHIADMDRLSAILAEMGVALIEDCAHTMAAGWRGTKSGNSGLAACFSAQTYKHINSGEGGLLVSDDPELMARAIVMSGSYMLYERHGARPDTSVFERIRLETPNWSGRMDNLRAAILRPQLAELDRSAARWNERYAALEHGLRRSGLFRLPERPDEEQFVGSSIQFFIDGIADADARAFVQAAKALGVDLKWFGDGNPVAFTSNHHSWLFLEDQRLPNTDAVLAGLFDMRIPLTFSIEDCKQIADIIIHCAASLRSRGAA